MQTLIRQDDAAEEATSREATAVVFPGQGSQRPGMAAPWRDDPAFVLWEQAGATLGRDLVRLGLAADADELRRPSNCQVALFVHHAVLFEAWRRGGKTPAAVAGHSLGEYNALVAAGVLSFDDGLRLVAARAEATQAAADIEPGGMLACLGGDEARVLALCAATGAPLANDNAPGQMVVAGSAAALDRLCAALADGPGRVIRLEVGAAYHSPLMAQAVPAFATALDRATMHPAAVPVIANVDAMPHSDAGDWPALLRAQLTQAVRWRETITTLHGMGITELVELAVTPTLSGMAKRIVPQMARRTITAPDDLTSVR